MNSKRSRLQRKAARLALNEDERRADEAIGKARAARDRALFEINAEYIKQRDELEKKRGEARKHVWEMYEKARADVFVTIPIAA